MKRLFLQTCLLVSNCILTQAYNGGVSGYTTAGCTCHSGSSSSATSLSFNGTTIVTPGSTNTYTLTLQHSSRPSGGFNLAIVNSGGSNAGTLGNISNQGTQVVNGELTHTTRKSLSNGSVSWQFTWQAPTTPGLYTARATGNAVNNNGSADANDQWNFLQSVNITVKGITITAPTPAQILCAGGNVTLQWTSYGISSVIVSISTDGGSTFTPISTLNSQDGQNSQTITLPSTLQPGNQYRIRLTDATDNTISSTTQNLTVAAPPSITAHPQNASVCETANATFSVTATGTTLIYQWRRNGTNLSGATLATLTLTNVTMAQAGSYDCVVTGSCGTTTSNAATLTIAPQTSISVHPQPATVCQGASYTFNVSATGTNLRYQWKKNNQDIPGATSSTYTIQSVALADTGLYSCTVFGDCGSPTSNQAQLQVALPPAITSQPQSQTLCEGQTITLNVTVNRAIANSFQWKKNGTALRDGDRIQGVMTRTLQITNAQTDDNGVYTVDVTNSICQATITSDVAQVTVKTKPTITAQPSSVSITRGGSVTISVTASGQDLQYQWYKNGVAIPSATGQNFNIVNAQVSDSGTYYVVVSNECGSIESRRVTVKVTDQPTPILDVGTSTLGFSTLRVGVKERHHIRLYNRGNAQLRLNSWRITGPDSATFGVLEFEPISLAAGDSAVLTLTFTPGRDGTHQATLEITSDGGNRSVNLTGRGVQSALTINPATIDTIVVGSSTDVTIQLCNQTSVVVDIDAINLLGTDADAFQMGPIQLPATVTPSHCLSLQLRFSPQRAGKHTATLAAHCKQLNTTFTDELQLHGEAVQGSSVASQQHIAMTIVPNPTSDRVRFDLGVQRATLCITTLLGEPIWQAHITDTYEWNCTDASGSTVPAGIYFAIITFDRSRVTVPFVIVR